MITRHAGALLLVALAACSKPQAGSKCTAGQALCENKSTVLACMGGTFAEVRCGGATGCSMVDSRVTCDDSIASVGDVCIESTKDNRACSVDRTQSLLCTKGTFQPVETCRGGKGCQVKGDSVACDSQGAQKGDLCTTAGALACSPDGKARLVCKDGKYASDRACKGPRGCHDGDFACDQSVADEGDTCSTPGLVACAPDGSREMVCEAEAFTPSIKCKTDVCRVLSETKIECR